MGRTACTEPQCLYKGALYLLSATTNIMHVSFDTRAETHVALHVIFPSLLTDFDQN